MILLDTMSLTKSHLHEKKYWNLLTIRACVEDSVSFFKINCPGNPNYNIHLLYLLHFLYDYEFRFPKKIWHHARSTRLNTKENKTYSKWTHFLKFSWKKGTSLQVQASRFCDIWNYWKVLFTSKFWNTLSFSEMEG